MIQQQTWLFGSNRYRFLTVIVSFRTQNWTTHLNRKLTFYLIFVFKPKNKQTFFQGRPAPPN